MKSVTLSITLKDFCIERALSEYSKSDGVTFRQFISDPSGAVDSQGLASCMNPVMDFPAINADISPFDEEYMNEGSYPVASNIAVSNIRESNEEEAIYCDVKWEFGSFGITKKEDALESFSMTEEELGIYMLQMHASILRDYGLRNNRRSQPEVIIEISE